MDLIERIFQSEGSPNIAGSGWHAFFTSDAVRNHDIWPYQKSVKLSTFSWTK